MSKIRFYHVKTLLWTYIVWAILNLWLAYLLSSAPATSINVPHIWVLLNIIPLWGLIMTLWQGDMNWFIPVIPGMVAVLLVIAGLLINRWWARFLVIAGMSIWFIAGAVSLGLGV